MFSIIPVAMFGMLLAEAFRDKDLHCLPDQLNPLNLTADSPVQ